jgi:hypothetical protein
MLKATTESDSESLFVKCTCGGCSVLEINFDDDFGDDPSFNIALWIQHPGVRPMSKKERLRWCEHVMKTGKPWADHTIVSPHDAQRIANFLNKKLTKPQNGKAKRS